MLSVQRVAKAAVIELMANRSLRRLATLLSVTALQEVIRMMSSRRAAPHQGSGCVTPPTQEAEYMAATVFPSASDHTALAFGLGPYMTAKARMNWGRCGSNTTTAESRMISEHLCHQ